MVGLVSQPGRTQPDEFVPHQFELRACLRLDPLGLASLCTCPFELGFEPAHVVGHRVHTLPALLDARHQPAALLLRRAQFLPVALTTTVERVPVAHPLAQLTEPLLHLRELVRQHPGLGPPRVLACHPVVGALRQAQRLPRLGRLQRQCPVPFAQSGELALQRGDALSVLDTPLGRKEGFVVVVAEFGVEPREFLIHCGQIGEVPLEREPLAAVHGVQ